MNNKNNNKNQENKAQSIQQEDSPSQSNKSGIYLRDDHCDWGSSGMNDLIETSNDNN